MKLLLYGEIGWEVRASEFVPAIDAVTDSHIDLHISSPGGDVFEALTIMNALKEHPATKTVYIDGLAASAASFIAVGIGGEVIMRPGAEMMIHNAQGGAWGDMNDMHAIIERLESASATIADIYAAKTGTDAETWRAAMDAETWFSADEALAAGLVDRVEEAGSDVDNRKLAGVSNTVRGGRYRRREDAPAPRPALMNRRGAREEKPMSFIDKLKAALGADPNTSQDDLIKLVNVAVDGFNPEVAVKDNTSEETVTAEDILTTETASDDEETQEQVAVKDNQSEEIVTDETANGDEETQEEVAVKDNTSEEPETESIDAFGDVVTIDRGVYEDLLKRAATGDASVERDHQMEVAAMVDTAIKAGKVLAARRDALIAQGLEDTTALKNHLAKLAPGTIPVSEKGWVGSVGVDADEETAKLAEKDLLNQLANSSNFAMPMQPARLGVATFRGGKN
nr:MAG TPA: minor capsid component [Caudoviricetes sp.]